MTLQVCAPLLPSGGLCKSMESCSTGIGVTVRTVRQTHEIENGWMRFHCFNQAYGASVVYCSELQEMI